MKLCHVLSWWLLVLQTEGDVADLPQEINQNCRNKSRERQ